MSGDIFPAPSPSGLANEGTIELAPIAPNDALERIVGCLGSAISQSIPSDDQIIMGHVREAHALALLLWRANR